MIVAYIEETGGCIELAAPTVSRLDSILAIGERNQVYVIASGIYASGIISIERRQLTILPIGNYTLYLCADVRAAYDLHIRQRY